MSELDDLIDKARKAQKAKTTDALIAEARVKQQPSETETMIANARKISTGEDIRLSEIRKVFPLAGIASPEEAAKASPVEMMISDVGTNPIEAAKLGILSVNLPRLPQVFKGIENLRIARRAKEAEQLATKSGAPELLKTVPQSMEQAARIAESSGMVSEVAGQTIPKAVGATLSGAKQAGMEESATQVAKNIALEKQGVSEYINTVYKVEDKGTKILREIAEKEAAAAATLPAEKIAAMTTQERLAYQTALAEAKLMAPKVAPTLEQAAELRKFGLAKREIEKMTTEDAAAMITRERAAKVPSVTKLTQSEKLSTPILGPGGEQMGAKGGGVPPNFRMDKADWEWIEHPPRATGITLAKGTLGVIKEKAAKGWGTLMREINPPAWVVQHEPTGRLQQIYQLMDESTRKSNASLHAAIQDFRANVKVPRNTQQAEDVAIWLDTFARNPKEGGKLMAGKLPTPADTIPVTQWNNATPEMQDAFIFFRDRWEAMGNELVKRGMITQQQKLKNYFFHMFPHDEIVQAWRTDLARIEDTLAKHSSGKVVKSESVLADLKKQQLKVQTALNTYDKQGTIMYDVMPNSIDIPFIKSRSGANVEGWVVDPYRSFERYLHLYHELLYRNPVIKQTRELMTGLMPEWKQYAHWLAKDRFLGRTSPTMKEIKEIEHVLTSMQFASSMGGNLPSAIRNATQNINTIVDAGFDNTIKGAVRALSSKGQAEWAASGHAIEIPGLTFESMSALRSVQDKLAYFFSKVESANRRIAFSAGLEKAERLGLSGLEASRFADNTLKRTQFYYGKLGAPKVADYPGGSIAYQFGTYTANQLNLFHSWIKKEPEKFIAYLLWADGISGGAEMLGVDLWGTLSVLGDRRQFANAISSMFHGDTEKAKAHFRMALPAPFGEGNSGVFPSGIAPVAKSLVEAYSQKWNKLLPVEGRRLWEAGAAILEGERTEPALGTPESGLPYSPERTGYPIRQTPLESERRDIKSIQTLPQILTRTLVGRPMVETRDQEAASLDYIMKDLMRQKKDEFVNFIAPKVIKGMEKLDSEGGRAFLNSWLQQQKPEVVAHVLTEMDHLLKDEYMNQYYSARYRRTIKAYLDTKKMQYGVGTHIYGVRSRQLP